MVELSKAFEYEAFDAFDRVRFPKVRVPGPSLGLGFRDLRDSRDWG